MSAREQQKARKKIISLSRRVEYCMLHMIWHIIYAQEMTRDDILSQDIISNDESLRHEYQL